LEDRLITLYKLQLIDDQLDELESLRGDLPVNVRDLEMKIANLRSSVTEKNEEKDESTRKREANVVEMERLLENQKRYKAQLYSVRNNKEYDALTKSIDQAEDEIKKKEMENDSLMEREKMLQEELDGIQPTLDDLEKELKEKETDLKHIVKSSEREESKIREERGKLEANVKKPDLSRYLQIRKAKNGRAVVTIRRNACSGCHNVIPSQRQLDIRKKEKLFFCDSCGRIIIPAELADAAS